MVEPELVPQAKVDRDDAPAIVACVVLERDARGRGETGEELIAHVKDTIGGLARPGIVVFVESLPPELDIESRRLALRRLALDPRVATRSTISTGDLLAAAGPADYR